MAQDSPELVDSEPGTELATITQPEQAVAALIRGEALELADDGLIREAIARRILYAETEEAAFSDPPTFNAQDHVGEVYEIVSLVVLQSKFGDGKAGYLACEATDLQTGEVGIFSTSSTKIGARLLWLSMHGKLPRKVRIVEIEGAGRGGRQPLDIELVG